MNADRLSRFAEQLIGEPVYIVTTSEGAPSSMRGAAAWTGRSLDLLLREWLTKKGRWQGRHPAIAFDDSLISSIAIDAVAAGWSELATVETELANANLVHEIAHICEKGIDRIEPSEESTKTARIFADFSSVVSRDRETPELSAMIPTGHGPIWARFVCHVWHRALRMDCRCPIEWTCQSESYGLPPIEVCDSALLNEPEALAYLPLLQIGDISLPSSFQKLFEEQDRCNQLVTP